MLDDVDCLQGGGGGGPVPADGHLQVTLALVQVILGTYSLPESETASIIQDTSTMKVTLFKQPSQ